MKIISLHYLLVNLTPSWKKKKRGCLDETPCPDVFPVPAPALIIPRLFLWESDAALAEHKEVREHPWTLSTRAHWYSNNMHTIWLRWAKRAFWILHLHVTLCPLFFLSSLKNYPHKICQFWSKEEWEKKILILAPSIGMQMKAVNLDN